MFLALQQQVIVDHRNILAQLLRRRRRKRRKAVWVRPWLAADGRLQFGHCDHFMAEMRAEDTTSFCSYLRMSPKMFDELLHWLTQRLCKELIWVSGSGAGLKSSFLLYSRCIPDAADQVHSTYALILLNLCCSRSTRAQFMVFSGWEESLNMLKDSSHSSQSCNSIPAPCRS